MILITLRSFYRQTSCFRECFQEKSQAIYNNNALNHLGGITYDLLRKKRRSENEEIITMK